MVVFFITKGREIGGCYVASSAVDDEAGCDFIAPLVLQWFIFHDGFAILFSGRRESWISSAST